MAGFCKCNLKGFSQQPYIFFQLILFQLHALKAAWVQSFKSGDDLMIISVKKKRIWTSLALHTKAYLKLVEWFQQLQIFDDILCFHEDKLGKMLVMFWDILHWCIDLSQYIICNCIGTISEAMLSSSSRNFWVNKNGLLVNHSGGNMWGAWAWRDTNLQQSYPCFMVRFCQEQLQSSWPQSSHLCTTMFF